MAANVFWDKAEMERMGILQPSILALGDSWFWYPMPGGSLLTSVGRNLQPFGHVIYARGMNGAEAFDLTDGRYARDVRTALRTYGATPDGPGVQAVFVSAGGNDFAGFNDLRPLLKDDCSGETQPGGCFRGLASFYDEAEEQFRTLVGVIYAHTRPGCKIVMHSYAYARPTGEGLLGQGGWLLSALEHAGVPAQLQAACIEHLIDCLHERLTAISIADPANLLVVDSRKTLASAEDWANELHPTAKGFQKIADQDWNPVLVAAGLMNAR